MIPHFDNKEDLFKHLKANKAAILHSKKSQLKRGDNYSCLLPTLDKSGIEQKDMGVSEDSLPTGKIRVKAVINTSNIMDSHCDVHIGNIWKKSLQELKYIVHLESHEQEFDAVISDTPNVTASVKNLSWASLGYPYEGNTQALVFDSIIEESRNEYMYNQYRSGYVKNHSVGMQYVTLYMCINSDDKWYAEEKANWDKYYPSIVNKEMADAKGYFWAVTEAKLIEGSAVVLGSNPVTPTQSVEDYEDAGEDATSGKRKPSADTHVNVIEAIGNFKFNFIN
mgnify:FL=1